MFAEYQADQTKAYLSEDALLGALLYASDAITPHLHWFKADFFTLDTNKAIYQCIADLTQRGESVDVLTVVEELRVRDQLQYIGGPSHLTELINSVPTHVNALTYAAAVYETWRKRETLNDAGRIVQAAMQSDTEGVLGIVGEMAKRLIQGYASANPLKPYLVPANELHLLPTVSWLIEGEVPEMGMVALYGPSGVGKSFVALSYALTIAQSRTVIYIAAEGQSGYRHRVKAWCKHYGKTEGNLYFFMKDVSILDPDEMLHFTQLIKELNPALIVVDTVAACFTGDENSTRDMSAFIRATNKLRLELQASVMLVHHTGKAGGVERGSSVLRGAADVMIKLTDEDYQTAIECAKTKDAKPFETRYIELLPVDIGEGDPVPVPVPSGKIDARFVTQLTGKQTQVLRALGGPVFEDGASQSEVAEAANIPSSSVWGVMNRLIIIGMARKTSSQHPYLITEKGRIYLRENGLSEYEPTQATHDNSFKTQVRLGQHDAKTQGTQDFTSSTKVGSNSNSHELHELPELLSFERKNNSSYSSRLKQRELLSLSSTAPKVCRDCGGSNFTPDPIWGWVCTDCRTTRQLDETAEV